VSWVRSGVVGDVPECLGITYRLVHTNQADSGVWELQSACFFYGCASLQQGTRRSRDHQNRDREHVPWLLWREMDEGGRDWKGDCDNTVEVVAGDGTFISGCERSTERVPVRTNVSGHAERQGPWVPMIGVLLWVANAGMGDGR
jgi:hypothetical protein